MRYQLIDLAVTRKAAHPRLPDRCTGEVRAVLAETLDGGEQLHELAIPVWTDTKPAMSEADIDMALLLRAAAIVVRLKQRLDPPPR